MPVEAPSFRGRSGFRGGRRRRAQLDAADADLDARLGIVVFLARSHAPSGNRARTLRVHLDSRSYEGDVLNAALIAGAQKVEHYEIATYGTARTYAQMLGESQAARLLQQSLAEEEQTDRRLTQLAMSINREARKEMPRERERGKSNRRRTSTRRPGRTANV